MIKKDTNFRLSPSYKNLGPWRVNSTSTFDLDLDELGEVDAECLLIVEKIIKDLESYPYQGKFKQHPLWQFYDTDNDSVIWSAEVKDNIRVTYQIFKRINVIDLLSVGNHKVL